MKSLRSALLLAGQSSTRTGKETAERRKSVQFGTRSTAEFPRNEEQQISPVLLLSDPTGYNRQTLQEIAAAERALAASLIVRDEPELIRGYAGESSADERLVTAAGNRRENAKDSKLGSRFHKLLVEDRGRKIGRPTVSNIQEETEIEMRRLGTSRQLGDANKDKRSGE